MERPRTLSPSLLQACLKAALAIVVAVGFTPAFQPIQAQALEAQSSVEVGYDAELVFADNGITETTAGPGYSISGTTLIISAAGTYHISGTCTAGSIEVAKSLSGVTLVLDNLTLTASGTAPIVVKKSSNVTIHLLDGTTSTLTDSEDPDDETSSDTTVAGAFEGAGVKVKSGSSCTFCGSGTLTVDGSACKNGIKGAAASTMIFKEGTYNVTAANNGIAADGNVIINGGTFDIDAKGDGIQADAELNISAGTFDITTLDGSTSTSFNSDSMSCKGLKASSASDDDTDSADADADAGNLIEITGGTFALDTADDAVHSDAYIEITGGTFNIATGDDGMHADTSLILGTENGFERDPDVAISSSYEGLEGGTVYLYSGRYSVVASDDGVNAAGGSQNGDDPGSGGGFNPGGGGPGASTPGQGNGAGQGQRNPGGSMGPMSAQATASASDYNIYVYGGDLYVNCSGDGLDSNGGLYLRGGQQAVFSQAKGGDNSAIDADGTILIEGATVFTSGTTGVDGTADNSWFGDGQKWAASKNDYSNDTCINAKEGGTIKLSYKLPKMANYTMASWPSSDSITLAQATSVTSCKGGSWSHSWDTGTTVNDVTTYTCSNCDDIERQTVESECTHSYTSGSTAQWTWADLSSATVTLTCDQCGETQTYDATVASSVEGDATTYTATYTYGEDVVFTDTKTVNTSADHTHTYTTAPTWAWTGFSAAKATFTCSDDSCSAFETVQATMSYTAGEETGTATATAASPSATNEMTDEEKAELTFTDLKTGTYTATFTTDGHATVTTYLTNSFDKVREENATTAVARDKDSGKVDISGSSSQVCFNATADDGYTITRIEAAPAANYKNLTQVTEGSGNWKMTKVGGDTSITITTAAIDYTVTANSVANGALYANVSTANYGDTVHVTATPASGYELASLTYTPEGGTAVDITSAKQFSMPAADVTLDATFTATSSHTDSPVVAKSISGATVSAIAKRTYSGKAFTPSPTVKHGTTTLVKGTDYTLSYVNNIKAGTATVIIKGKGAYTGTKRVTFKIVKAANSLKFKKTVKTLRASALKTAKKVVRPLVVKRANGTVTYTRVSGSKYLKIAKKTGKVTVAKGTPKGIYKIRVKVRALGNSCYKAKTKTVLLKVRVK